MPETPEQSPAVWRALKAIGAGFMKVSKGIGWVVSRVVLSVVYFVVFTPAALVMKLVGFDPMRRKADGAASYFVPVKGGKFDPERCKRMY